MQINAFLHNLKHSKLVFRRPLVIPRVVRGMLTNTFGNKSCLRMIDFIINTECNSKCIRCYATRYKQKGKEPISPESIRNIWTQANKLGAFLASLSGGEPTLHPKLFEILAALKPHSNIIVLVSNSVELGREGIKDLKKNGLAVLHLSLDSADPKTNDAIRGHQGHFDCVMANVEHAKEFGLPVYFSSVLTHNNKEEYLKLIELAEKLRIGISGALLVAMGRYADKRHERLTLQDREWFLKVLKEKAHIVRIDWNNNLSNRYECPAGYEKISVGVHGDVMPCVCNHLAFGNALEEPLKDIYARMQQFSLFKERNPLCLASFDTEYLREYLDPIAENPVYPVSIFNHPKHPARLQNGKIIESRPTS
ncbi:MAG: radical SAM protein [bacterium]|nr:radical SAM protein [bacterium]